MIKVFITGSPVGQLHWELLRSCPDGISISSDESLDITDTDAVKDAIAKAKPDVIINPSMRSVWSIWLRPQSPSMLTSFISRRTMSLVQAMARRSKSTRR